MVVVDTGQLSPWHVGTLPHPANSTKSTNLQERIMPAFLADGTFWPVTGIDGGIIRQHHQLSVYAIHKLIRAAARQISPADTGIKQRITGKDYSLPQETNTAGCMPRSMKDQEPLLAQVKAITLFQQTVGGRGRRERKPEDCPKGISVRKGLGVIGMDGNLCLGRLL